jgi:predicted transposase YbfD/YdcC
LLTCLLAALLCQCDSTHAVEQWCQLHQPLLRRAFPPQRFRTPSGSLYRRLLARLPVEHLEWLLAGWVRQTRPAGDDEPVALDGKTVRSARPSAEASAPHRLTFYTHHPQEVLVQMRVEEKTNEIPVAQALISALGAAPGRIYTADALHTQTALVAAVRAVGGHVVLTVKANQPTLLADLATAFADPTIPRQTAQTIDRQHGRNEVRALQVTGALTAYLAADSPWPDIAQVARLTRTVTTKRPTARTREEVVYLLTTLSPQHACPHCLLRLVRGHWQIENGLHHVREVTFGEDRSRLRTGHAPQIRAALRNLALTLLHRAGHGAIAAARRAFAYQPSKALALVLSA